jgi:hypothetical protein
VRAAAWPRRRSRSRQSSFTSRSRIVATRPPSVVPPGVLTPAVHPARPFQRHLAESSSPVGRSPRLSLSNASILRSRLSRPRQCANDDTTLSTRVVNGLQRPLRGVSVRMTSARKAD